MRINALVENDLKAQARELLELRDKVAELKVLLAVKDAEIAQLRSYLAIACAAEGVGE